MKNSRLKELFGKRGAALCERFFYFGQRFPKLFPKKILRKLGCFLSNCRESFLESRSSLHLSKILFAHAKLLQKERESSTCLMKVLEVTPAVYGLALVLFPEDGEELELLFFENRIVKEAQNIVLGIKPVLDSFLVFRSENALLVYLEIKKMRGGGFSMEEKTQLVAELPSALEKEMESSSAPSLFFPENQEALFKNIRNLGRELRYINDLPQVMITIVECYKNTFKFLLIVLRVLKPGTPSIKELSAGLPPWVHFSLENLVMLDRVRKKYSKEATVFTLQITPPLFDTDPSGGNLRMARKYIVKALEKMLGPFRDYNGGLIHKEEEQWLAIKRALERKGVAFPVMEKFFYGIHSWGMRSFLSVHTTLQVALLFNKMENNSSYCFEISKENEAHVAMVKTKEKVLKNALTQGELSHTSPIGTSFFEHEGYFYICFYHQYPQEEILFPLLDKEFEKLPSLQQKSILRINFQGGDPPSLNPRLANDIHCHILANLLFEGLTQINPQGKVELAMAKKVSLSSCRRHYTFHLHPSWWSNGEEVTAFHFEHAWKKALASPSASRFYLNFFSPIKNARKARDKLIDVEEIGVKALDPTTLTVELESPCSYFLNLISTPFFFPLFGEGEEPRQFNGPFMLEEWKRDEAISLTKNPFFRDASTVKLDGISISMVHDPGTIFQMFEQGELDVIGDPISPLSPEVLTSHDFKQQLLYKPVSRVFWIHCNTQLPPLDNVDLRRALSLAIDRTRLTTKVFINQIPHVSPLPIKYASFKGGVKGDPESAVRHFEKALHTLGISRSDFPRLVISHSDLSFEKALIAELQAQWKEVLGISVAASALPWNEFSAALERGEFQLGGLFRRDFYGHPLFYLNFFKPSPNNPHSWENEKYKELLQHLHGGEESRDYLQQIEQLLVQEVPVISLVNQRNMVLVNKRVKGIKWCENGCLDLKEAQIDENTI